MTNWQNVYISQSLRNNTGYSIFLVPDRSFGLKKTFIGKQVIARLLLILLPSDQHIAALHNLVQLLVAA